MYPDIPSPVDNHLKPYPLWKNIYLFFFSKPKPKDISDIINDHPHIYWNGQLITEKHPPRRMFSQINYDPMKIKKVDVIKILSENACIIYDHGDCTSCTCLHKWAGDQY
jgi:hypothetical protein